jgi:hypothetical protein
MRILRIAYFDQGGVESGIVTSAIKRMSCHHGRVLHAMRDGPGREMKLRR